MFYFCFKNTSLKIFTILKFASIPGENYYRSNPSPSRFGYYPIDQYYPKPISIWKFGRRVDALFRWAGNNKIYFFAGNQYYRYSEVRLHVSVQYTSFQDIFIRNYNVPGLKLYVSFFASYCPFTGINKTSMVQLDWTTSTSMRTAILPVYILKRRSVLNLLGAAIIWTRYFKVNPMATPRPKCVCVRALLKRILKVLIWPKLSSSQYMIH